MTITPDDLRFFRAERPTDLPTGGGRRTSIAVGGGAENTLFPDIAPAARAAGAVQMRKFYPSVVSEDADVLMSAQVGLAQGPADPALDMMLFAFGDQQTTRAAAGGVLNRTPYGIYDGAMVLGAPVPGDTSRLSFLSDASTVYPTLGAIYQSRGPGGWRSRIVHAVSVGSPDAGGRIPYTFSGAVTRAGDSESLGYSLHQVYPMSYEVHLYSAARLSSAVSAGASSVPVNRVEARLIPDVVPMPGSINGLSFDPRDKFELSGGRVPIFRVGEAVAIAGGGASEVVLVSMVDYRGILALSAPLVNSYPAGATVSSLINLGDLGASVGASFSQQTWTKTFSDTLIGSPIGANYDQSIPITTTNLGAITERWAFVFTSASAYKLIGERVGQVATGTTTETFAPINPLTNRPYFTIQPAGWGGGWATGNVLRLNSTGAYSSVWAVRTVSPSTPGGLDGSVIEMRGGVDA